MGLNNNINAVNENLAGSFSKKNWYVWVPATDKIRQYDEVDSFELSTAIAKDFDYTSEKNSLRTVAKSDRDRERLEYHVNDLKEEVAGLGKSTFTDRELPYEVVDVIKYKGTFPKEFDILKSLRFDIKDYVYDKDLGFLILFKGDVLLVEKGEAGKYIGKGGQTAKKISKLFDVRRINIVEI